VGRIRMMGMTGMSGLLRVVMLGVAVGRGAAAFDGSGYARSVDAVVDAGTGDVTYKLHWTVNGDTIRVALDVATTGWVGFGIGEQASGGMKGADIVYGYVSGGYATVVDAHSVDTVKPEADCDQDWTVEGYSEAEGRTVLELSRALVTENVQEDRMLVDDGVPTKVLLAWGPDDLDEVSYHGSRARSIEVELFKTEAEMQAELDTIEEIAAANGTRYFEIRNNAFTIPATETWYEDTCFSVPVNNAHALAFEAVVRDTNRELVHHFTLYGITSPDCKDNTMAGEIMLWAWGPGAPNFVAPDGTGFALGAWVADGYESFMMQTHYHNPERLRNVQDSSGIRVYYTEGDDSLQEVGVYQLGDPRVRMFGRKVGTVGEITQYQFDCPASCTTKWSNSLTIFGVMLHMHSVGFAMHTDLIDADGAFVPDEAPLGRVDFFDFNFHSFVPISPPRVVQPGTGFRTTCMYQNDDASRIFGLGSEDEMCINFVYYYPKLTSANKRIDMCGLGDCGTVEKDLPVLDQTDVSGWGRATCAAGPSLSVISSRSHAIFFTALGAVTLLSASA